MGTTSSNLESTLKWLLVTSSTSSLSQWTESVYTNSSSPSSLSSHQALKSSALLLTIGMRPSLWAMNSSLRTELLISMSTRSMASVGTSLSIIRRSALAMLKSVSRRSKTIVSSSMLLTLICGCLCMLARPVARPRRQVPRPRGLREARDTRQYTQTHARTRPRAVAWHERGPSRPRPPRERAAGEGKRGRRGQHEPRACEWTRRRLGGPVLGGGRPPGRSGEQESVGSSTLASSNDLSVQLEPRTPNRTGWTGVQKMFL
mmetsp:Transcript_6401/g.16256  ORF Transcript_6401/g.16256 Transcript_6401/m.16256 type:complete len:260 (-) Transcript_6401:5-784(-)